MNKTFHVYAAKEDGGETFLDLPVSPWELLDVQDKLRLKDGEAPYISIEEYYRFDSLGPVLSGDCSLRELNALAQKLSELDERQSTAFEGMIRLEGREVMIPRAIDLACSAECCHVVEEARNDAQLGRFYAENGFVPQVEDLPDELFDLLDFERIGREMRQGEGGVFAEGGYVLRHSAPAEVYKTLDFTLKAPDYAILLELEDGERLELPARNLPSSVPVRCLDCKTPSLMDAITGCEEDMDSLNQFAQTLAGMEPEQLTTYKALLEATECRDLDNARQLADTLDEYILTPQYSSPVDVAMGELFNVLDQSDIELLTPYLNLYQYGQALIQHDGSALTDYGLIDRKDGEPIQKMEDTPQWGGMEMR